MLSSSGNPSGHKRQVFGGIITPITPPHIHQLTPFTIHILQYSRFHNQTVRANITPCTKQLVENITWERHWIDHLLPFGSFPNKHLDTECVYTYVLKYIKNVWCLLWLSVNIPLISQSRQSRCECKIFQPSFQNEHDKDSFELHFSKAV